MLYSVLYSIYFVNIFSKTFLEKMAHNVPAVYDVLPARKRALRSKDQGRQNVPQ